MYVLRNMLKSTFMAPEPRARKIRCVSWQPHRSLRCGCSLRPAQNLTPAVLGEPAAETQRRGDPLRPHLAPADYRRRQQSKSGLRHRRATATGPLTRPPHSRDRV
jgi:hypothetical protein